jgi:prevent-host-death family protein
MITRTAAEAQDQFGELLDTVEREPVAITRNGGTAAFMVSPQEMEELISVRENRKRGVTAFDEWTLKYGALISPEATGLSDDDIVRMVHEARDEAQPAH